MAEYRVNSDSLTSHKIQFSHFCTADGRGSHTLLWGASYLSPLKLSFRMGRSGPKSLGPPESNS